MLRKRLLRLPIILLGFVVALGILEGVARLTPLYPDSFVAPDTELGWRLRPDATGVWFNPMCPREYTSQVQISSTGYHAVPRDRDGAGARRVLIVGDSLVAALEVPPLQAMPHLLETALNEGEGERVEVIPMGVPNYSTAQEWLMFERDGAATAPDVVLLVFTPHNDFRDNHPWFADSSGDYPMSRPYYDVTSQTIVPAQEMSMPPLHRLLLQHSVLYRLLSLRARAFNAGAGAAPSEAVLAESWQITFELIDRLRDSVEATGARFLVVVDQSHISSAEERAAVHGLIREGLDERGIASFSLLDAFDAAQAAGSVVRFACDTHWTPAGHALAAEVLAPVAAEMLAVAPAESAS